LNASRARLDGADLTYADLSHAVLDGADLTGARLSRANLHAVSDAGARIPGRGDALGTDPDRALAEGWHERVLAAAGPQLNPNQGPRA
jgi:uncharacterized protein YjbI with pentapeptide repeats